MIFFSQQMKELLGLLAHKNEVSKAKNVAKNYKNDQLMEALRTKIADSNKEHPHVIREPAFGNQEEANVKFAIRQNKT